MMQHIFSEDVTPLIILEKVYKYMKSLNQKTDKRQFQSF